MFPDCSTCSLKGARQASERERCSKAVIVAQRKVDGHQRITLRKYL